MKKTVQNQVDSLVRAEDFFTTHGVVLGAIATSADRKTIDDVVNQVRTHITAQGTIKDVLRGQNALVASLAATLWTNHVKPLARFARASLKGVPDFATLTKRVKPAATKKLLDQAYVLANTGKPYLPAMTTAGFPADTLDQLTAAANDLNTALLKREPMRTAPVESTKALETLVQKGREAIRRLDGVMMKKFVADGPSLAAWKAASRVMPNSTGSHKPAGTTAPATATTPVVTPPVAPAPTAAK
jgi:restriction endonuclease Mrr